MKEVKNIFKLANLEYREDENLLNDLENIIKWVNILNEIDLNLISEDKNHKIMELREDKIKKFNNRNQIIKNIPEKEDNFFVVPKVINNG